MRVHDVRVEELRVDEEVAREVATQIERERDRHERVDNERGEGDGRHGPRAVGEVLERTPDPPRDSRHRRRVASSPRGRRSVRVLRSAALHAMSAAPEISVVIPCLNEEEAVGKVVDQAFEGIRRSGRAGEVIVVDNGSTDRSAEVAADTGRASSASDGPATAARTSPGSRRRAATSS